MQECSLVLHKTKIKFIKTLYFTRFFSYATYLCTFWKYDNKSITQIATNSQKSSKTAKKSSRSKPTFGHQSCTPQTSPEYAQYQLLVQRLCF